MAYDPLTPEETAVGKPVTEGMLRKIRGNEEFFNSKIVSLAAADIPNGSFDIDSDGDEMPDSWTKNLYPGGLVAISPIDSAHGSQCLAMYHPGGAGNGGGFASSDYVPCSELIGEVLSVIHWATAAGMHNQINVSFYSRSKTYITTTTLYDSTHNPTSPHLLMMAFTPPAGARFFKIRLHGGIDDVDVSGYAYFDGVTRQMLRSLWMPQPTIGEGTIAEQSTNSTSSYVDAGSFTMALPVCGLPVMIRISAEVRVNDPENSAAQRFRIGGVVSSGHSTNSTSYVTKEHVIQLTAAEAVSGQLTVVQQLQVTSGGQSFDIAYGRKLGTGGTVTASPV